MTPIHLARPEHRLPHPSPRASPMRLSRLSLAAALGEALQLQEAHEMHRQLLSDLQREYGREHPLTARVELNFGLDLYELEQPAAAREALEHARAHQQLDVRGEPA